MAKNIEMQYYNGLNYEVLYPRLNVLFNVANYIGTGTSSVNLTFNNYINNSQSFILGIIRSYQEGGTLGITGDGIYITYFGNTLNSIDEIVYNGSGLTMSLNPNFQTLTTSVTLHTKRISGFITLSKSNSLSGNYMTTSSNQDYLMNRKGINYTFFILSTNLI